jgi:hypothetical protein
MDTARYVGDDAAMLLFPNCDTCGEFCCDLALLPGASKAPPSLVEAALDSPAIDAASGESVGWMRMEG